MIFTDQNGKPIILDISAIYHRIADDMDLDYKANAMMLQNVGNTYVIIDNQWTIGPGGSHALGSMTDLNRLTGTHNFKFLNTANLPADKIVKQLEICETFTTICTNQNSIA